MRAHWMGADWVLLGSDGLGDCGQLAVGAKESPKELLSRRESIQLVLIGELAWSWARVWNWEQHSEATVSGACLGCSRRESSGKGAKKGRLMCLRMATG